MFDVNKCIYIYINRKYLLREIEGHVEEEAFRGKCQFPLEASGNTNKAKLAVALQVIAIWTTAPPLAGGGKASDDGW